MVRTASAIHGGGGSTTGGVADPEERSLSSSLSELDLGCWEDVDAELILLESVSRGVSTGC